jgi:hypothetical protein
VGRLPSGPPEKDALARIVDEDEGCDEAESTYYEWASDPLAVQQERAQRRYRGSYFRRLRRLTSRSRDRRSDS